MNTFEELQLYFSIWPFLLGTAIGIIVFVLPKYMNSRKDKKPPFELTPNCLLTRNPVMLLSEPELPSQNNQHGFTQIFQMLKEHGYKVEWTKIPVEFEDHTKIKTQILELLNELVSEKLTFHFFISNQMLPIFRSVLQEQANLGTVVISQSSMNFEDPRLVLHRAVELAEQDFHEASLR